MIKNRNSWRNRNSKNNQKTKKKNMRKVLLFLKLRRKNYNKKRTSLLNKLLIKQMKKKNSHLSKLMNQPANGYKLQIQMETNLQTLKNSKNL